MLSNARQAVGRALEPVARAFIAARISANAITMLGLAGTLAAAVFVARGSFGIAAAFFVPSAFLDLFDGMIARKMGTASNWGALIDSLSDRAGEGALLVAFAYRFREQSPRVAIVALAALVCSYMVSYVKSRAESLGFRCEGGLAERPERAILFGAALLIVGAAEPMMWALAVLSSWTVVQRLIFVRRQAVTARAAPPA
jgi:CDP-diacylglycerol--glycerol-3-phosphate 3-phosphatidyltransferase